MSGLEFEWESAKAEANLAKHGVTFEEALTVFMDPIARIHKDPDHSESERREIIVRSLDSTATPSRELH